MPALSRDKDFYRRLLEAMTAPIVLLDDALHIMYMNPAAEHLFASSATHLINTPVQQLFYENDETLDAFRHSLAQLHPYTKREAQLQIPHCSQPATVDYTVTPQLDCNNKPTLLLELRPLDRLLRISREDSIIHAHQATRALVRGVAHEIKNPLGGIRGAAQLLAKELEDVNLHDYTDIIIAEADRLRNLVDKLLGPRKLPEFKSVNIHQVLERVKTVVEAENGQQIIIKRDYDPSLPELQADGDQMIQAILNVVRNARQAMLEATPPTATPEIALRTRALRQFTIGNSRHRLICMVEIEDNGPGVDKDIQETLFFPMVSGRAHGTGLGLSIAQSILNQHQGLIECESKPGQTLFRLLIPINHLPQPDSNGADHAQS